MAEVTVEADVIDIFEVSSIHSWEWTMDRRDPITTFISPFFLDMQSQPVAPNNNLLLPHNLSIA